ncbi:MAG: response regulator, partial [Clostridia bacterium]|nr:response regulator [Clostridia bacterium]
MLHRNRITQRLPPVLPKTAPNDKGDNDMFESHSRFHSANDKRRILVVEDEQINREILGFMLEASYDVCFAETGAEALRILDEDYQTLSLVLLDLNLPDMKGIDILHRIKGNGNTAVLPIIVMTADQDAEVECLSIGATDFISKPYPKQEIVLARIRRTIELFEDRDILHWTERDNLTGLYNSEFFYRYAIQIDSFHQDTPMDAIVLDINHFHMLNERFGNSFGNEALKRVAETLLAAVSDTNGIVSRKTADTFLIYCPHRTDYQSILDAACVELTADCHVRARMGVYSEVDRSIDIERRFDRAK